LAISAPNTKNLLAFLLTLFQKQKKIMQKLPQTMESEVKLYFIPISLKLARLSSARGKNSILKSLLFVILATIGAANSVNAQFRLEASNNTGCD